MSPPRVLLVVRGRVDGVRAWARKGLVPVWLVPDVAWTLVVPAGEAAAAPPYDDPVVLLGGRPMPGRLRPSVCLVADGPRAVIAVQRGRSGEPRWLAWRPDLGAHRVEELAYAPPGMLHEVVIGAGRADRRAALREALRPGPRSGAEVVDDLVRSLALPGAGVPIGAVYPGDLPGAVRIDPDSRVVQRFDHYAAREAALAAQLEDQP
jgi:hypothetical protein